MEQAVKKLQKEFGCAVLCKGGHSQTHANDVLYTPDAGMIWFRQERISNRNTHGTGCTLSSAIACGLAKGDSLTDAVANAKVFMTNILKSNLDLGHGNGPLDHGFALHHPEKI
ncbi:MAG: hydroxymethylpyrimidine/phosphomethylpyrimidine kinase, partial [Oscillospiraceae bacterium]|nr:hydroxymethylpyrimidine/phosphomethylpyrimidine kinase [Oscillospiraceae bacterium]